MMELAPHWEEVLLPGATNRPSELPLCGWPSVSINVEVRLNDEDGFAYWRCIGEFQVWREAVSHQ
jgi:hypothetical protein